MRLWLTILLLCGLFGITVAANALSDFADLRWQYRVIVLAPDADSAAITANRHRIDERDVVWFVVGRLDSNYQDVIEPAFWAAAERRLARAGPKGNVEALLIGKDGGDKRAQARFDLEALFDAIDAMPMRRQEMRQNSTH